MHCENQGVFLVRMIRWQIVIPALIALAMVPVWVGLGAMLMSSEEVLPGTLGPRTFTSLVGVVCCVLAYFARRVARISATVLASILLVVLGQGLFRGPGGTLGEKLSLLSQAATILWQNGKSLNAVLFVWSSMVSPTLVALSLALMIFLLVSTRKSAS